MPEPTLAQRIKAKYPGQYDDIPDRELEERIVSKFPGMYDDMPRTAEDGPSTAMRAVQSLKNFAGEASQSVNPLNIIRGINSMVTAPVQTGRAALAAQEQVRQQALEAYRRGDTATALAKGVEWLIPFIGPRMSEAGDMLQRGEYAKGLGASVDAASQIVAPEVARRGGSVVVRRVVQPANTKIADAIAFARREGVPVDAATATGSGIVQRLQKRATDSMGGSRTAEAFKAEQAAALERTGRRLAERTQPGGAVVPETAGQGVRDAIQKRVTDYSKEQNKAYGALRRMEEDPRNAADVPKPPTPEEAAFKRTVNAKAKDSAGRVPTDAEWAEMRRIRDELDSIQYEQGGTIQNANKWSGTENDFTDGDMRRSSYVRRSANADVYHDIRQEAPGTSEMTGRSMVVSIDQALSTGRFTNAAKGALEVARKRIAGSRSVSSAKFEKPGTLPPVESAPMNMPVNLADAKAALRPLYERITRQLPITQQRSSPGLKAIENILNGPDYAPVSQVDMDLGTIKGLARGADLPEMRDLSQGVAAQAVKVLHRAVDDAARAAGPQAVEALRAGRAATVAKVGAADTLKKLSAEPVQAYGQLTYRGDAGIDKLRKVAKLAPEELPKVGRAFMEDLINTATAEGGFARAQGLYTKWQALGPQTKAALFKDPALVQDIDRFFLLAKKIGENPNPSGTAGVLTALNATAAPATWALAKLFYSRRGVDLLTKGIRIPLGNKAAVAAWVSDVTRALGEAPGRGMVPATAGELPPEARREQRP